MKLPIARKGDRTAHGGVIAAGDATVLVGDRPAARQGDHHDCPARTGGAPHVGGPVVASARSVLIGDRPAARVMDEASCTGPTDGVAVGDASVLIDDVTPERERMEREAGPWLAIELRDEGGSPVPGQEYVVLDSVGREVARGVLDHNGRAMVGGLAAGEHHVRFTGLPGDDVR